MPSLPGMYYWFLFLAFIYVPYGADVQTELCNPDWMVPCDTYLTRI